MNNQELLKACLEKIEKYRDMVKAEYPGGMPLQVLLPALREAIASPRPEALDNPVAPLLRGMALALERDIQGHQKVEPAGLLQVVRTALSYLPSPLLRSQEKT